MPAPHQTPGVEFYAQRVARARAVVPEAQRSPDVRLWLRVHEVLEQAFAALPEVSPSTTRSRPLEEPAGDDAALAALLQLLAAAFCDAHSNPQHPSTTLHQLAPQLPPLMRVWQKRDGEVMMQGHLRLDQLAKGAGLEQLARLELVANTALFPGIEDGVAALDALLAAKRPLFDDGAAAALDDQLAVLQRRSGLPSAAQLQVAWTQLTIEVALLAAKQGESRAKCSAVGEWAARQLLRLQPDNPHSHYAMGKAAVVNATTGFPSPLRDPLPHLQRGLALVREQGSDYWLARCGWILVMVAAADSPAAVTPAAAAALLEEADAAQQRCKALLPPQWASDLKAEREMTSPCRREVAEQAARSPGAWHAAIQLGNRGHLLRKAEQFRARVDQGPPRCDGCGLMAPQLKRCACHLRWYCSVECQKRDRRAHRAECEAALARRAAAKKAAGSSAAAPGGAA